ncbi:MAG: aminotransferase class V-fold PLP-dependent enzyme [Chromatiales bacterium]|nr:aminotransferase class V-fold PLP-dependent enzyme [Chromatiales bacterium]
MEELKRGDPRRRARTRWPATDATAHCEGVDMALRRIYLDNNATTTVRPGGGGGHAALLHRAVRQPVVDPQLRQPGRPGDQEGAHAGRRRCSAPSTTPRSSSPPAAPSPTRTAILSALKAQPERREIITTAVEHPAVLSAVPAPGEGGLHASITWRWTVEGRLDLDAYGRLLSERVAIVSVMWANNETGHPVPGRARWREMAQRSRRHVPHRRGAGGRQGAHRSWRRTAIDMLSLSGHKLHAPKGIGVLYLRRGTRFRPLLRGGHQERGRRAGTENTAAIVGLGEAARAGAADTWTHENTAGARPARPAGAGHPRRRAQLPSSPATPDNRLPNTSNIAFEYVEGEAILLLLNKLGIAASSGSACTSGSLEPSHVMRAMGIPYTAAHGTIRFSLSRYNTAEEIERVIAAVPPIVAQLRRLSPYWGEDGPIEEPEKAFAPAYA